MIGAGGVWVGQWLWSVGVGDMVGCVSRFSGVDAVVMGCVEMLGGCVYGDRWDGGDGGMGVLLGDSVLWSGVAIGLGGGGVYVGG